MPRSTSPNSQHTAARCVVAFLAAVVSWCQVLITFSSVSFASRKRPEKCNIFPRRIPTSKAEPSLSLKRFQESKVHGAQAQARRPWDSKHQDLSVRLAVLENELMSTIDFKGKPNQSVEIVGLASAQLRVIKELATSKRYRKLFALVTELAKFVKKLSKDEQPYQRVHDLVEVVRHQHTSGAGKIASFKFGSEELVLFGDVLSFHNSTPFKDRGSLRIDLSAQRASCEEVINEAIGSKNIRQQAESAVIWTKFAAMECGANGSDEDDPGRQPRMDVLRERVLEHLEDVDEICARQEKLIGNSKEHPMKRIVDEAADVRKMMRDRLSSSEMRMVVETMAKEFGGTGHWYRCANGHPFSVGECGLPMQLAKCPECGAGVGGQSHRATEGVTQARDIDEMFGRMAL